MKCIGAIIPKIEIPILLGGGIGEALSFNMPPEYHALQYRKPFCYGGKIFWFEEIPLRGESCAYLCIEKSPKIKEIKIGIPFYIKRAGFTVLNRNFGATDFLIIQQTAVY